MPSQLYTWISYCPRIRTCFLELENAGAKAKSSMWWPPPPPPQKKICYDIRDMFLMELFIRFRRNQNPCPKSGISCFVSASASQFVKCEGKAGWRPSAAAVMDQELRSKFWTLVGFEWTLRGRRRKFYLQRLSTRGYNSVGFFSVWPKLAAFWI